MAYIKVNGKDITSMYHGNTPVVKAYRGDVVVYEKEEQYSNSGVTFDLNSQWQPSTRPLDGYTVWESFSNYGIAWTNAWMKIEWSGMYTFDLYINAYANYDDYTIAYQMDLDPSGNTGATSVKSVTGYTTPTSIDAYTKVTYYSDTGEHFAWVCFRRGGSGGINRDDKGRIAISVSQVKNDSCITQSNSECIYENGKWYTKLIKQVYEDGLIANEYGIKGNELTGGTAEFVEDGHFDYDDNDYCYNASKYCYTTSSGTKLYYLLRTSDALPVQIKIISDSLIEKGSNLLWYYTGSTKNNITAHKNYKAGSVIKISTLPISATRIIFYYSIGDNGKNYTSLDISGFDTSNVVYMSNMFYGCSSLTSLDISGFDTSNVTSMTNMFYGCSSLTSLDISGFDTSNVVYMSNMFYGCSNLTTIGDITFKSNKVSSISGMFCSCYKLTKVDLSGLDTSNVEDMSNMFYYCSNLTTIGDITFKSNKLSSISGMFCSCYKLTKVDLSGCITTDGYFNTSQAFNSCSKLSTLLLGNGFFRDNQYYTYEYFNGLNSDGGYTLSQETWNSFYNLYNRTINGLPIKDFYFRSSTNFPGGFMDTMSAMGYSIRTS